MTKCGFVALIGEPNAGKSTLLNSMVGSKVSIVTHKVQTTRARIRGIAIEKKTQIIFIDTPGVFEPRRRLDRAMVAAAWSGAADADIIVLMIEANRGITQVAHELVLNELKNFEKESTIILAINKIDRVKSERLLSLAEEMNYLYPFTKTFLISAKNGYGVDDMKSYLAAELPIGPWLYPENQIADLSLRMIASEITREKLTLRLHQELPYQLTVETEGWKECKDGSVRIDQLIYVMRDGHKGIILGSKGTTIKSISICARNELEKLFERKVHLFIQIKVREGWLEDAERYSAIGLAFKDGS